MADARSTRPPARFTATVARGLRESAVIVVAAFALVLLTALATYSPSDPGFSFTGTGAVQNRIGPFGAWLADVLFFLFGRPAFLFPLMLGVAAVALHRAARDGEAGSRANSAVRACGFLLVLLTSCALATLHWAPRSLPQTAGGVIGSLVGGGLGAALGLLGATLALLALFMAGVSLAFGVSWFTIMDRIGAAAWGAIGWSRARSLAARDAAEGRERKQARKETVETDQKKAALRVKPRIEQPAARVEKSERVEKERQVPLFEPVKSGELPPLQLLDDPPQQGESYSPEALEAMSRLVELKLKDFGVEVEVVAVQPGPVVTRFELRPAPGVKVSQISSLAKDLARALSAISVRVVEVIPGKSVMGLEIPNEKRELVTLGEIIKSKAYDELASSLVLVLGKDIGGHPVVADLGRMPHLLVGGTTGSGKTFVGQRILQEMLDYYPRGAIRLFIVEDSNEIILNGWNGDGKTDTGNIIYTVTRPEIRGGPPPVTMYDLIRSALRSRPHGVVIGEARGAEAWELIRAAATGHGHSAFTIHATSAEHVWPRFLQVVQAHPDAARMSEIQIAQSFAEAVTAAVYIERNHQHGQIVREIVEVSTIVERTAARPSFSPLFKYEAGKGLMPTGNRPMRPGFRANDLNIPESIFKAGL